MRAAPETARPMALSGSDDCLGVPGPDPEELDLLVLTRLPVGCDPEPEAVTLALPLAPPLVPETWGKAEYNSELV